MDEREIEELLRHHNLKRVDDDGVRNTAPSAPQAGNPLDAIRRKQHKEPLPGSVSAEDDRIVVMTLSNAPDDPLGARPVVISRARRKIVGGAL